MALLCLIRRECLGKGCDVDQSKLIRMANQIARNFQHLDESAAIKEIAQHIQLYWTKPMRAHLLDVSSSSQLDPVLIKVIAHLTEAQ